MINLATARRALWQYATTVPYETATVAEIGAFDAKLNQVVERFFSLGTWRSMWRRLTLAVYGGRVTAPRGVDTVRMIEACCTPLPLYSQFHHFVGFAQLAGAPVDNFFPTGPGVRLLDETAQTFRVPHGTYTLRAVATEAADPGLTFIGGVDQDGNELFGATDLPLVNGTANTTQQLTRLPWIEKAVTAHPVRLYSVDVGTSVATLIASYAPGETIPNYRQYGGGCISSCECELDKPATVSAICKLGFVPVIAANDIVIPGNLGALKLGLQALEFENRVDPQNAPLYWGGSGKMIGATDLLDAELSELQAGEQVSFSVSETFGAGSVVNVR